MNLLDRLERWQVRLGTDRNLPWIGLGLIGDLQMATQLLGSREWLEFLRANGTNEQSDHARQLLADLDTLEAADDAAAHVRNLPKHEHALDPVQTIEALDDAADELRSVRFVLEQCGALAADDHETPIADLLRALLS